VPQLEYELESELETEGLESELEVQQLGEFETAPSADYEIIGADTRVRAPNTTIAPFRYICNLEVDIPGRGGTAVCSGTLIGPTTVLTAGHCVPSAPPSRMRVIPGRNGSLEPLPATRALSFSKARGWVAGTATDYGVVQLRDPIGIHIGYWSIRHRLGPGDNIGTSISTAPLPLDSSPQNLRIGFADSSFGNAVCKTDNCQRSA
jgi:V8-like Glu-specific endopeptidase